jgi:hypothetical protein
MTLTIDLSDDLTARLLPLLDRLPQILDLGLREWNAATQSGFQGAADVLEFLAGLPTPEETLKLRPSPALRQRVQELLDKNKGEGLTADEEIEWQQYEFLEHLVRMAKARALIWLNSNG